MTRESVKLIHAALDETPDMEIILRGVLDTQGVSARRQRRSKYGAKRPK